jgi:hypothetical protein
MLYQWGEMTMQTTFDEKLGRAFKFTEADLKQNRQGVLTREQFETFKESRKHRKISKVLTIITFLLFVTVPVWAVPLGILEGFDLGGNYNLFVGVALLGSAVFLYLTFRTDTDRDSLTYEEAREVVSSVDMINLRRDDEIRLIIMPGESFSIIPGQFKALKRGHVYRVHYAPALHRVVSIEWLADEMTDEIHRNIEMRLREERQLPEHIPARVAQLWHFDSDDLEANRRGQWGANQLEKARKEIRPGGTPLEELSVQSVEGDLRMKTGKVQVLMASIPRVDVLVGDVTVTQRSFFATLLLHSLHSGQRYRLYYVDDPHTNEARPLSIEEVV